MANIEGRNPIIEALIGYLYLDKNYERLEYIISEGIKIIEANM